MLSNRLVKHFAAAAAASVVAGAANAAIVHWADANLIIPANIDGLYINVETRATGTAGSAVAGWDINPYSASGLTFFNATGAGIYRLAGATTPSNVPTGTLVDAAGIFGGGSASTSSAVGAWVLNSSNYFGFRFVAADGGTKYGWGRFVIGAALNGADRMIAELAYEDSGGGIAVGEIGCPQIWYRDIDNDGIGWAADGTVYSCSPVDGYAATDGDNCPSIANPEQTDANQNRVGDACELARGDLNLDGVVNASDIPLFLNAWGSSPGSPADFNSDGVVDGQDFAVLLSNWGTTA